MIGVVVAVVAVTVFAPLALAVEVIRTEYKAAVEPICKSNTQANERILAGVQQEVRRGKLQSAAAKFVKASDEARLAKWFTYVKTEAGLFAMAGKKLDAGDKAGAEHIVVGLTQNANRANLQVLPFGFRYCRLEPARFT